jgi:LPXTG-motif cell wall-anchored protein
MIAAGRRRAMVARVRLERLTRSVDRRANSVLVEAPRLRSWTRKADHAANRALLKAWPLVARMLVVLRRLRRRAWRLLRPLVRRLFRLLGWLEPRVLRARDSAIRAAVRASRVLTPERALCLAALAAAACLAASQFVDYRAVEIGQPGYAGLPAAEPPSVASEQTGEAHAYLLLPLAGLAALLALAGLRRRRRRADKSTRASHFGPSAPRRGWVLFALGGIALATGLLVDRPAGLELGGEAARFSGATAVLRDGLYAELASAAALMLTGALLVLAPKAAARYHARPCRIRISSFARAATGLRRRLRRRASSRGRATRRGSRPRSGAASAPASPR